MCSRSNLSRAPGNFPPTLRSGRLQEGSAGGLWTFDTHSVAQSISWPPPAPPRGEPGWGRMLLAGCAELPPEKEGDGHEKNPNKPKNPNPRLLKGGLVSSKAPGFRAEERRVSGCAPPAGAAQKPAQPWQRGSRCPPALWRGWLPGHSSASGTGRGHGTIHEPQDMGEGFPPLQSKVSAQLPCPNPVPAEPKPPNAQQETSPSPACINKRNKSCPGAGGGSSNTLVTTPSPTQPQGLSPVLQWGGHLPPTHSHPSQAFPPPGSWG